MRTVATLHAPINARLLRAALDDAGPDGQVSITGVGATARLVVTAPTDEQATPATD
ncbi:MAG: hypothetical protein SHS37scaffold145_34 [Phage 71_18]|nr:MAG: hypothetical protein SHS37scaffold145_34 [Phage 71_18]